MSARFNPPPFWQQHLPSDFHPAADWIPETAWGAPPAGWPLWVHTDSGYPAAPPEEYRNNPYLFMSVMPGATSPTQAPPAPGAPATFQNTRAGSLAQPAGKKPMGKGAKIGLSVVGLIVFIGIVSSCGGDDKETAAPAATPSATATTPVASESPAAVVAEPTEEPKAVEPEPEMSEEPETEPEVTLPAEQQAFSDRVAKAADEYDKTDNELRMSKAITDRDKSLCKSTGGSFKGWKATVHDVGSTGDGYGYFTVLFDDDIEMSTWNNALSDISDDSLIKPSNKLFNTLLDLSSGDTVTVSGNFLRGQDTCVKTSNMTEAFNAISPDFKVDFTAIKAD